MPAEWTPCCMRFSKADNGWKMVRGGQSITWVKCLNSLTSEMTRVGAFRRPDPGPRDSPKRCLETIGDVVQFNSQWRSCIQNPSFPTRTFCNLSCTILCTFSLLGLLCCELAKKSGAI